MNSDIFFANIRREPFDSRMNQSQVDGVNALLNVWSPTMDERWLAYILATVFHETMARMQPVREGNVKTDQSARRAVERLARERGPDSAVARYAKPDPETGHVYYGRGLDQLTFRRNYERMGEALGEDLVNNPDLMLRPDIAARSILLGMTNGLYTGKKLSDYFRAGKSDPVGARRIVNGTDQAGLIAGHYNGFLAAIRAAKSDLPADPEPEPLERETAAPRYPEEVKPLGRSKTIYAQSLVGGGATGAGVTSEIGEGLAQAQDTASQLAMYIEWAKWIFIALIVAGAVWTIYERIKAHREGRR